MAPTVGRIVHYYPPPGSLGEVQDGPWAAMIVQVREAAGLIRVKVFPPTGNEFIRQCWLIEDQERPGAPSDYCVWPPREA